MPSSFVLLSTTRSAPISCSSMTWIADCTVVSGRMVTGGLGCSTLTRSSMRLCSTRFCGLGWSICVRSCWQWLHSSLPGRLSCPQLGQIIEIRVEVMSLSMSFELRCKSCERIPGTQNSKPLFNDPDVVAGEQVFELGWALGFLDVFDLLVDKFVVSRSFD